MTYTLGSIPVAFMSYLTDVTVIPLFYCNRDLSINSAAVMEIVLHGRELKRTEIIKAYSFFDKK